MTELELWKAPPAMVELRWLERHSIVIEQDDKGQPKDSVVVTRTLQYRVRDETHQHYPDTGRMERRYGEWTDVPIVEKPT